jgi:hypothetical protein
MTLRRFAAAALMLAALIGLPAYAEAQPPSLTREAVEQMTEEQQGELPMALVWELLTSGEEAPPINLNREVRISLAILHYGLDLTDPTASLDRADTAAAVQAFQERLGRPSDGVLKVREFTLLMRYAMLARMPPLALGMGLSVREIEQTGTATAQGSWVMEDLAYPLNYAQISCSRETGICEMTSIDFGAPDFRDRAIDFNSYHSFLSTSFFYIDRWADGIIEARAGSLTDTCRETRLTINVRTETVFQVTQDLDPDGCPVSPFVDQRLPRIVVPRIATLQNSRDVLRAYYDEIRNQLRGVYGPLAPPP